MDKPTFKCGWNSEGKVDELVGRLEKKPGVAKDKMTMLFSGI